MTKQKFSFTEREIEELRFRNQLVEEIYKFYLSNGADRRSYLIESYGPKTPPRWELRRNDETIELPSELQVRWSEWQQRYAEACGRNPLFELHEMMHAISESHTASSWPGGYETRIWKWLDADDVFAHPPFDDRHGIATPSFYNRLRELREICGGWFYFFGDTGVTFVPEHDLPDTWAVETERDERNMRSTRHLQFVMKILSWGRNK